ncbi:MAG: AAA family ATPase [Candidatus Bathyarchaeia archaeon]
MKIEKIEIKGFRGIKNLLELNLNSKSCLVFGENGSGKSSITDAVEWFYSDKIQHLSNEEIDRKGGITAIRNIHIPDDKRSYVSLHFSDKSYDARKEIDSKLRTASNNTAERFKQYVEQSCKEKLILRYADLTRFILATKTDRLNQTLNIMGFDNVSNVRDILKKAKNEVDRRIRIKNFDNEISRREAEILEKLGERVVDDTSFIEAINRTVGQLGLSQITSIPEIDNLLSELKTVDDTPLVKESDYLERTVNAIMSIEDKVSEINKKYKDYFSSYNEILRDVELLKQLALEKLWQYGVDVIEKGIWQEDRCPLCFQDKNRTDLVHDIQAHLVEVTKVKEKRERLEDCKNEIRRYLQSIREDISHVEKSEYFNLDEFKPLKEFEGTISSLLRNFNEQIEKDFLKSEHVKAPEDLQCSEIIFNEPIQFCDTKRGELQNQMKGGKTSEVYSKIELSRERFKEIRRLKKEKELLESYSKSMTLIYNEFMSDLKAELDKFTKTFSSKINEYYSYMHPGENVSDIKIKIIEEEDNLKGLTIEYDFHNTYAVPPQKYLSESHLNSLGIALFLTSVEAFNKINKFFILDDVISSFDTEHRKRLADLLLEKFKDYQILILTHEQEWFSLMKNAVKGKDWYINVIKWNNEYGTHLEPTLIDLKTLIETKIKKNEQVGLGNLIRQYFEMILKEICEDLEVKMPYRSNETNEKRMCGEMLSYLKGELNKQPCKEIFDDITNKIMSTSLFVADKGSHYDSFQPSLGDYKSLWDDVIKFESLFYCYDCEKHVSLKNYDALEKKIRCKCGNLNYEWKK